MARKRTTRLPPPRESEVLKGCIAAAKTIGIELRRRNVGGMKKGKHFMRFGTPGEADLYGCIGEHATRLEIEVKRPGNKPTPHQLAFLEQMRSLGCVAFWTDSSVKCLDALRRVLAGGRVTIEGEPVTEGE